MVKRRQFLGGFGALALAACNPTVIKPTPIVKTHSGSIQGDVVQGVHRFLGIPYAAPPFGQYRFRSRLSRPVAGRVSSHAIWSDLSPNWGHPIRIAR